MKAIIPVAGEGTRLRPHTHTTPKVLINVAGKPILGHILESLVEVGVDEIVLIVGYRGDQVTEYVTGHFDLKVHVVRQDELLGLGHAIYLAREWMDGEPAMIVLGDTIVECDFRNVIEGGVSSIGVKEVEDPRRFGVVEIENGFIKKLVEKPEVPPSNLAIIGLYYIQDTLTLKSSLVKLIEEQDRKTKGEYQLTDALQLMLDVGVSMTTFPVEGWFDCGKPETVLETNRDLLAKNSKPVSAEGCIIREPVYISDGVTLVDSIIGPNVSIAEGSSIESSIIEDSIINRKVTVKNVTLKESLLGEGSVVEGSFLRLNIGDSSHIQFGE